jgi:dihydrofolate synthase/folylpolyglutamate synthase
MSRFPETKASLIFSAVADKDISGTLKILAPLASRIFLCPVNTPRAISAEEIAKSLPEDAPPNDNFGTFEDAFSAAMAHGSPLLIAGSLFLIGEARALLLEKNFQSSSQ